MSKKHRILIVDDETELRSILATILSKSNFEVKEAEDGSIAKAILEKENFDVIISDIKMPKLSGVDLFKWNKKNKNIPTILITGFSELLETQQAYDMGVKEFLAKPFHKEEIINAVWNCLNIKNSNAEVASIEQQSYSSFNIGECIENNKFKFDIFLRLADDKYIRIASKGSEVPNDKLQSDDFTSYGAIILVKRK